jgi:hypothetical protein
MSDFAKYIEEMKARASDPDLAEKFTRLEWRAMEMALVLERCAEYFDNRADADMQGDPPRYVPNEEMRLLVAVREALGEDV